MLRLAQHYIAVLVDVPRPRDRCVPSPLEVPHVARAKRSLAAWSDAQFGACWNSSSSFLDGRRRREVLAMEPG